MKINKRFSDYVDQMNRWSALVKRPPVTFPLSHDNALRIASHLENALSPENISCDGELKPAQVRAKYNKLMGVKKDFEAYCHKHGLAVPECYYEY